MTPLIKKSIRDNKLINLTDDAKYFSEDIIINIDKNHFDTIRFIRFAYRTFSFATVLRKILRLFLIDKIIEISETINSKTKKYNSKVISLTRVMHDNRSEAK